MIIEPYFILDERLASGSVTNNVGDDTEFLLGPRIFLMEGLSGRVGTVSLILTTDSLATSSLTVEQPITDRWIELLLAFNTN